MCTPRRRLPPLFACINYSKSLTLLLCALQAVGNKDTVLQRGVTTSLPRSIPPDECPGSAFINTQAEWPALVIRLQLLSSKAHCAPPALASRCSLSVFGGVFYGRVVRPCNSIRQPWLTMLGVLIGIDQESQRVIDRLMMWGHLCMSSLVCCTVTRQHQQKTITITFVAILQY